MIKGIEHLGLMAKDPEKLAQWYEEVLDFRVIYKTASTPPAFFIAGQEKGVIEIIHGRKASQCRLKHIAIVNDDFETVQRLRNAGRRTVEIFAGGKVVFQDMKCLTFGV